MYLLDWFLLLRRVFVGEDLLLKLRVLLGSRSLLYSVLFTLPLVVL